MTKDGEDSSEEPLPKLPRAPLFRKLTLPALVRVGMFATLLYATIVLRKPCSEGVGRFVGGFDPVPDAGPISPSERYPGYELLTTEELLKRYPDAPNDAGFRQGARDAGAPAEATVAPARDASSSRVP